jgi:hypothetical protein
MYWRRLLNSTMTQEKRWPLRLWRPRSGAYCIVAVTCMGNFLDYFSFPHWKNDDIELNVIWAKGLGGYVPFNPHLACKGFKSPQYSSILVGEVITEYCLSRLWCAHLKNRSVPFHLFPSWSQHFPIYSVDAKPIEREREALHSELIEQGVRGMSARKWNWTCSEDAAMGNFLITQEYSYEQFFTVGGEP